MLNFPEHGKVHLLPLQSLCFEQAPVCDNIPDGKKRKGLSDTKRDLVKATQSLPLTHKRGRPTGAQGSMNRALQGPLGIPSLKSRSAYLCTGRTLGNSL